MADWLRSTKSFGGKGLLKTSFKNKEIDLPETGMFSFSHHVSFHPCSVLFSFPIIDESNRLITFSYCVQTLKLWVISIQCQCHSFVLFFCVFLLFSITKKKLSSLTKRPSPIAQSCALENRRSLVRSPDRPIFFPRIDESHCDRIH